MIRIITPSTTSTRYQTSSLLKRAEEIGNSERVSRYIKHRKKGRAQNPHIKSRYSRKDGFAQLKALSTATKALFLQLQFLILLRQFTGRAEESCAAVSTAPTLNVVPRAHISTLHELCRFSSENFILSPPATQRGLPGGSNHHHRQLGSKHANNNLQSSILLHCQGEACPWNSGGHNGVYFCRTQRKGSTMHRDLSSKIGQNFFFSRWISQKRWR
jgi:hypothetical protein